MAQTLTIADDTTIELSDYINYLQSGRIDFSCEEDIVQSAFMLKRLCNNKYFLADMINKELTSPERYQLSSSYNALIYLIHAEKNYAIRAAIWPAREAMQSADSFLYGILHDHNFNILTCGYHGPGYKSLIYSYNPQTLKGFCNEEASLNYEEETVLSEGKVMYLSAARDVHVQIPPEALSISINLIVNSPKHHKLQCDFDPRTHKVIMQASQQSSLITLAKMAKYIGNTETVRLLKENLKQCPCPKARAACYQAILNLDPKNKTEYIIQAKADSEQILQSLTV